MTDSFGRQIDYLRLSITDRCNLRCRYCMPHDIPSLPHEDILRYEEILRVCGAAAALGVSAIRVTGGEPLVRRGCAGLVARLKAIPGIHTVTLTTNGVLLAEYLDDLLSAGLDGVNISLDTLDAAQYAAITGRDALPHVLAGLDAALAAGLPTKLNCVPLAETGTDGLLALAALAENRPVDVRFIEMMPIGHGKDCVPLDFAALERAVLARWPKLTPSQLRRGSGPARYYAGAPLQGSVGFIAAVSHSFCQTCNRVRLTSEGFLKLCLCYGDGVDLRSPLREGISDEALMRRIAHAMEQKPAHHTFAAQAAPEGRIMSQIGG